MRFCAFDKGVYSCWYYLRFGVVGFYLILCIFRLMLQCFKCTAAQPPLCRCVGCGLCFGVCRCGCYDDVFVGQQCRGRAQATGHRHGSGRSGGSDRDRAAARQQQYTQHIVVVINIHVSKCRQHTCLMPTRSASVE